VPQPRQFGFPGTRRAVVVGAGSFGTAVAVLLAPTPAPPAAPRILAAHVAANEALVSRPAQLAS
jgi:hypothetical protein